MVPETSLTGPRWPAISLRGQRRQMSPLNLRLSLGLFGQNVALSFFVMKVSMSWATSVTAQVQMSLVVKAEEEVADFFLSFETAAVEVAEVTMAAVAFPLVCHRP